MPIWENSRYIFPVFHEKKETYLTYFTVNHTIIRLVSPQTFHDPRAKPQCLKGQKYKIHMATINLYSKHTDNWLFIGLFLNAVVIKFGITSRVWHQIKDVKKIKVSPLWLSFVLSLCDDTQQPPPPSSSSTSSFLSPLLNKAKRRGCSHGNGRRQWRRASELYPTFLRKKSNQRTCV